MILSESQEKGVEMALFENVSLLCGYAGTGKTTVLDTILKRIPKGVKVRCCCPTGKAAKRMRECTGFPAETIHRLLEPVPKGDEDFSFSRNEQNPIEADLIIMDECSMVGISLMSLFLEAVRPGTRLLFVGDPGQLPPVSHGAPFRDMIKSGVIPKVELMEVFRNSGEIIRIATDIRDGRPVSAPLREIDIESGVNFRHIQTENISEIIATIKKLFRWAENAGFHPVWDVQAVTATNEKSDLSCQSLNETLSSFLLPNAEPQGGKFRVGEKVVYLKNEFLTAAEQVFDYDDPDSDPEKLDYDDPDSDPEKLAVVNGDIGEVVRVESRSTIVKFFDPERVCKIGKKSAKMKHAFALTCHKMQGSESPVVIVPVHNQISYIMNNPWIYTAITRGKSVVFTVGDWSVVQKAIAKPGDTRKTFLEQKLKGEA